MITYNVDHSGPAMRTRTACVSHLASPYHLIPMIIWNPNYEKFSTLWSDRKCAIPGNPNGSLGLLQQTLSKISVSQANWKVSFIFFYKLYRNYKAYYGIQIIIYILSWIRLWKRCICCSESKMLLCIRCSQRRTKDWIKGGAARCEFTTESISRQTL